MSENDNLELELDLELELEPIEDENANKQIAPDIPFDAGVRLIPVICSACKTRLYAGEDQVGLWKRCPDCERLTEIRAVPARFILTADDPEAAGGYGLRDAEVSRDDISQLKTDNLNAFEAEQKIRDDGNRNNHRLQPVYIDEPPVLEGALNNLLKSDEEKNDEARIAQREKRIETEVNAVKKAVRGGRLDEYLASTSNNQKAIDPAERKRLEKQRQFEAAASSSLSSSPTSPNVSRPATPPQTTPPTLKPASTSTSTNNSTRVDSASRVFLWTPLFDRRCRARMVVLTICGFIGNLTGEKARSMIWQASIDRVYDQVPGYAYNWSESGLLFMTFWVGVVLSVVWLSMLFLFGVSLFEAAAEGKDRVDQWIPFNLDFGFSYIGWSLFILWMSGIPGFVIWHVSALFLPDLRSSLMILHFVGQFFCFPILFLCVIESDTFYGNFPRKTLTSLYKRPLLWLLFYIKSALLAGVPIIIILGLMFMGTVFFENWFMQSVFYYLIASILLTFAGYFVLLYFRYLGKTAWEI
ncbi:MAG: hypothetical protein LBH59_09345, partial [Planctomycetaceae bacterium]|nr:hypothetical protein [Planctomycetaceae bacterium]